MKPSYPSRGGLVVRIPALVAFVSPLSAAPVVWDNSNATGAWSTAANWDTNVEPTSADAVTFPFGLAGTITTTTTENALSLTFNDTYTLSGGTLALASGNSIDVADGVTATINNQLTITGGLLKTGTGTLVLTALNTNAGGTVISAGKLRVSGSTSALGAAAVVTTVNGGTILELDTGYSLDRPITLMHGGTVAALGTASNNGKITIDAAATTVTLATDQVSDVFTIGNGANDVTGGSGSTVIGIAGPGAVRLGAASDFDGSWNIPSGRLELGAAAALGDQASSSVTLAGGTLAGRAGSGGLAFTGPAANLLLTANSSILSDRATTAAAGVNNSFGTLSMGTGILTVAPGPNVGSGTATVTLGNVTLSGNPTFAVNDAGSANGKLTTGSILGGAARTIAKSGAGDLAVTGGSTDLPAGSTFTATGGGTIEMLFPNLGATTPVAITAAQNPFGEASVSVTDGALRLLADGSGTTAVQTYQLPTAITLGGSVTLDPDRRSGSNTNKTFELPGLTLAADTVLGMSGNNTHGVRLTGPLALSGDTTLQGVSLSSQDGLLTLDDGISGAAGDSLTIAGGTSLLNLTINAASTYGGGTEMSGSNVTLNAANAFGGGATSLSGGSLIVNAADALVGTVTLSGGTLRVNGPTFLANNSVLLQGGTLDLRNNVGASIGATALTLSGASTLNLANNGSGSGQSMTLPLLNVSGDSSLTLTNANNYTPTFTEVSLAGDLTLDHAITARIQSISEDASPRALVKTGAGTLELEGASSHSGGTEALAGILLVEHATALGSGSLTLGATSGSATATAQFNSGLSIANDIVVRSGSSGTATIDSIAGGVTWTGGLSLQKAVTLDVGTSVSSYDGAISGTGAITKISSGELVLGNPSNSFLGNIAVTSGTLSAASDGALGDSANDLTFSASTTFKATGSFGTSRTLSFTSGTGNVSVPNIGHTLTLNSGITGAATFTKLGDGVLAFGPAADSSARGAINTNINVGTLRLSAPGNVSDAGMITISSAGILALAADADTDFVHPVTANSSGSVIHVDRATAGSGSNGRHTLGAFTTINGNLTVTGDNGYGLTFDSYTATAGATLSNDAPAPLILTDLIGSPGSSILTLTIDGAGDIHVADSISETVATGSFAIRKRGEGTFRFGSSVADFGRLTLVEDGTLDLNGLTFATDDVTLGGAASALGARIATGATGLLDVADVLTFSAATSPPGAMISGNIAFGSGARTILVGDSSNAVTDLTLDGPVSSGAGGTLTKSGAGVLRMSGAGNTLSDAILVSQGTLELAKSSGSAITAGGLQIGTSSSNATVRLQAAGQIDDSAPVALSGSSEVILDLNGFTETVGPLSLTQTDVNDYSAVKTGATGTLVLNGNLTLNNNANSTSTDGREVLITGSGGETTPATDGTLDLGGAVRTIHVATTTFGTHEPKANATIETQIINGGILKTGPRILILNHPNNTFNGGLQIAEGTVKPATFASLGTGPVSFTNSGAASAVIDLGTLTGTMAGDLTVGGSGSGSATLLYSGLRPSSLALSGTITLQRDLTVNVVDGTTAAGDSAMIDITGTVDDAAGSFGLVKIGNGTLRLAAGNTFSGGTTVRKGILTLAADSALGDSTAALTLDGGCFHPTASISAARDLSFGANGGSIRVESPQVFESSGAVTWGSGLTTFFGSGTTILSGSSSGGGGDLTIGEHIAFASSSFTPLATAGHTLSLRGTVALPAGNLKMVKSAVLELGSGNLTRAIGTSAGEVQLPTAEAAGFAAHGADRAVNFGGAGAPVVWGQQSPPFLFQAVSGDDYGDLILGAATATHTLDFQNPIELNTSIGGTFFSRNLIVPDGPAALDARISGGILQSADPNLSFTSLDLEVAGTLEISGPLNGEIELTKYGAGTAILSGTNTRSGGISIDEGTLVVAGDASWNAPEVIFVGSGAELDVSALTAPIDVAASGATYLYGTLTGDVATTGYFEGRGMVDGDLRLLPGGYAYPANEGFLHITGDFTQDAASNLDFYASGLVPDTEFNRMRVGGAVTLAGDLSLFSNGSLVVGDSLVLIHNDGVDPISGTFSGLPEGGVVPIDGVLAFQVTYLANGDGGAVGNDFGVTVVLDTFSSDLSVYADAPVAVDLNGDIHLVYTIDSPGPGTVSDGILKITLPANATFSGSTPAGTVTAGVLSIPLPTLAPSDSTTVDVHLTAPGFSAAVVVEAEVTSAATPDSFDFNNFYYSTTAVLPGGCPVLTGFTRNETTGQLEFGIETIEGVTYILESSTDLGLTGWSYEEYIYGDGLPYDVQVPMDEPREFFRFRIEPNNGSGGGGGGESID